MALFQENVVIIDRGSHAIRALLVRRGMGAFDILKKETLPALPAPAGDDSETDGYNLFRFIQTLFPDETSFYLPIKTDELYIRNLDLPTENQKLATEILPSDLEAVLPVALEEIEIVSTTWQVGNEQSRVLAFAVQKQELNLLADPVIKSGKSIGYITPEPYILSNALKYLPAQEIAGRIIGQLDVGYHSTQFNLNSDGKLAFARRLPIGGNDFTLMIAQELDISETEAEQFKLESGIDIYRKDIDEIDLSFMSRKSISIAKLKKLKQKLIHVTKELGVEIERSILASPIREPVHLYISGGGSLLKGLTDVLEETTNLRFRRYPLLLAEEGVEEWINCLGMIQAAGLSKNERLDFLQSATGNSLRSGEIHWRPFYVPGLIAASSFLILMISFIFGIVAERGQLSDLRAQINHIAQGIPGITESSDPVKTARAICQGRLRMMRSAIGGYRSLDILKEVTEHTLDSSQASIQFKGIRYTESEVEVDLEVGNMTEAIAIQERFQASRMFSSVEQMRRDTIQKQRVKLVLKLVLKPIQNSLEVNCR